MRSFSNQKLIFNPGEKFAYSNAAYEMLGDVIAKVSGESFEDYVQQNILTPLGMKDSTLLLREANQQLLTSPHVKESGKAVVSKVFPYNRAHSPSSTLYSNIEDMSRWAIANLNRGELDGKRILKPETVELMRQPVVDSFKVKEGISWFVAELQGHRLVLHDGGDVGFESRLLLAPDDGVAVIAMTNSDYGDDLRRFTERALHIILDLKPATKESTPAANAATAVTEESKQKADEVLAAYVKALGGRAALEKVNSRAAKGTFEVMGIALAGPFEMFAKAPNRTLMVMTVPGQTTLKEGFDGMVGWQQDPEDGVVDKTGLEQGNAMRDADFYQPLKLRSQYPSLFYKGATKIAPAKPNGEKGPERDVFVLEAPRNGQPRRFYFDASTALLIRVEDRNQSDVLTSAIEYDDYREVDGIKVPFALHYIEDAHFIIKLAEVKQNLAIEDAVFVKPKK